MRKLNKFSFVFFLLSQSALASNDATSLRYAEYVHLPENREVEYVPDALLDKGNSRFIENKERGIDFTFIDSIYSASTKNEVIQSGDVEKVISQLISDVSNSTSLLKQLKNGGEVNLGAVIGVENRYRIKQSRYLHALLEENTRLIKVNVMLLNYENSDVLEQLNSRLIAQSRNIDDAFKMLSTKLENEIEIEKKLIIYFQYSLEVL